MRKNNVISNLQSTIARRYPAARAAQLDALCQLFCGEVSCSALESQQPDTLLAVLQGLLDFAGQRRPGEVLVRAFNPDTGADNRASSHSIIEVITEDRCHLVASLGMALQREGLTVHQVVHPVVLVERDPDGQLLSIGTAQAHERGCREAIVRFEIDGQDSPQRLEALVDGCRLAIEDVCLVDTDSAAMQQRLAAAIGAAATVQQTLERTNAGVEQTLDYLGWLRDGRFTFIGYAYYSLSCVVPERCRLALDEDSRLGILRLERHFPVDKKQIELSPYLSRLVLDSNPLILTKSTYCSPVGRAGHLDYLGVKQFDTSGQVVGEHRFFGLYGPDAYSASASEVPLLRLRVEQLWSRLGVRADSYRGRLLQRILAHYPRDEMLQCNPVELEDILRGMLEAHDRPQLRVFSRSDVYGRFVSAMVMVPREKYSASLRRRLQQVLLLALDGSDAEYRTCDLDGLLATVQYRIHTTDAHRLKLDIDALERRLAQAMLSWEDRLRTELVSQHGEAAGLGLLQRFGVALPAAYREDCPVEAAARDLLRLQGLSAAAPLAARLYLRDPLDPASLRFKLYGRGQTLALSSVLPILENLGAEVISARPYDLVGQGGNAAWMLDFDISGDKIDPACPGLRARFEEAFIRTCQHAVENDGYNRLIATAGLDWRQVVVLRAIGCYLGQIQLPFSQPYLQQTLARNSAIAGLLMELFEARFDPRPDAMAASGLAVARCLAALETSLEAVQSLDEDRILRAFLAVIQAVQRTNFYQRDARGMPRDYLSLKLSPAGIADIPRPCPLFEIFVYSPRVEGVHLRGGKVARGGLRWSDRREDYRTEILGLLKAQMVKNAVIVPQGSKGGFYCKHLPEADAVLCQQEAVACYQIFIRALLDVTDNLVNGEVVAPHALVRHDGDDPYLVVAADKGTATFSDIANAISREYGFWLGDAFASGGGNGYDHKKMGITARGAWESVKRLFREQGRDTQRDDFTVVGIGDMAGDVFGNGMLLSRHIRLVAAFNHRHIFIDPAPDAASSYGERERLFNLPGSAWSDYDRALISPGGGVFERSAKLIPLSLEIRQALAIEDEPERVTPAQLVRHILQAPVDLLWNGGIGTYVKAGSETDASVKDRANDAVRINGQDLRCKVVAEGGNLGLTQRGRIEYARAGGLINTDAIDNAAGVDCSDHEVNIKVLLNQAVAETGLALDERNRLLAQLDDAVACGVLDNNYRQAALLSQELAAASRNLDNHVQLMHSLALDGGLDARLEYLPDAQELARRAKRNEGLSRPELAVLVAYSKLRLSSQLEAAQLADNPGFSALLEAYFPAPLVQQYPQLIQQHPLRHQILATQCAGELVNRMGASFATLMIDELRCTPLELLCAYSIARELLGAESLWAAIDSLGTEVPYALQRDLLDRVNEPLEQACRWLLGSAGMLACDLTDIQATLQRLRSDLMQSHSALQSAAEQRRLRDRAEALIGEGIPGALAEGVAQLPMILVGLDIVQMRAGSALEPQRAGQACLQLEALLQLNWLRLAIHSLPVGDRWQRQGRASLRSELDSLIAELGRSWRDAAGADGDTGAAREAAWFDALRADAADLATLFEPLQASPAPSFIQLSVLLQALKRLTQTEQRNAA
ncbi:NAD-glutamate dehydrogenase [Marinobacterium rhizophilum]|uniref:NAD-glutamate dehydrogenase n=1 Tax=Marinobacterium rhizophilum TaxID=420402 RepID=A0ABY5HGI6_9GAMM|nr:NAD-glutamate dehydrogenase [Marinobacterium rhizophilum]UTW10412.1 NAD-glutamate dehydrogenase [Marinobacterium rhizophilum]